MKIILTSHGEFCSGLLDSLEMVAGSDFGIRVLPLTPGTSPEDFRERMKALIEAEDPGDEGVVVAADIAGGTPFNSAIYLRRSYHLGVVGGVSLPILLTLALEGQDDTVETLLERAEAAHANGIKVVRPANQERTTP
ncbi:MAG: hypothetical protein QM804_05730 [Propionicimonas sp.]